MIPELDPETGYLPVGNHIATMAEVEQVFGTSNRRRREIFRNLTAVLKALADLGVPTVWLDGSFVTDKIRPDDVDVVYRVPAGADPHEWGEYAPQYRHALEKNMLVDLWPYPSPQPGPTGPTITILEFFASKNGVAKGLVRINLGSV